MQAEQKICEKCDGTGRIVEMRFIDGYDLPKKCYETCDCAKKACIYCDDGGWQYIDSKGLNLRFEDAFDAQQLGHRLSVRRCQCKMLQDADKKLSNAKVPERYRENTQMRKNQGNRDAIVAMDNAFKCIESGKLKNCGVFLYGKTGVGKTMIISHYFSMISNSFNFSTIWVDFRDLIADLKLGFDKKQDENSTKIDDFIDHDIVFIDDIGTGRNSQFEIDTIERIVHHRYSRNLPVFITTNLSSEDLYGANPILGDRTMSRLQEMCEIIEVKGNDFRKSSKVLDFKKEK